MTTLQQINSALSHHDAAWAFNRLLDQAARDHMDRLLTDDRHPLAFQAGTQWARFQALHRVGHVFGSGLDIRPLFPS